jgi:alpha-glucosidase
MYFSSGDAKADNGERYTFVWNKKKFPDPAAFLAKLTARGYRICCNIKPGILTHHPWYNELASNRLFIETEEGVPLIEYYWSNYASFPDFQKKEAYEWAKAKIKQQLIDMGVEGIWNDNNEFEMEDAACPSYGFRQILPVSMAQCAYEALAEAHPGQRPWLITRSGFAGIQRYASTWSGDNCSDEETMLLSFPIGMNLGLSGIPFYGHDIGGFFGPTPSATLLLRWCQAALFQPRYIMHSWKPDGRATEPWMYPEVTEQIIALIKLRYRFLPYLYSVALHSALSGIPMERPLCLEYPTARYALEAPANLIGDDILVLPPEALGEHSICFTFPPESFWMRGSDAARFAPGTAAELPYPADWPLFFYRSGSVIPLNMRESTLPDGYPETLELFAVPLGPGEEHSARDS